MWALRTIISILLLLGIVSCVATKETIRQNQDSFLLNNNRKEVREPLKEESEKNGQEFRDNYLTEGEDKVSEEEKLWLADAENLTEGFTTFPSSEDVTNHLNTALSGPIGGCLNFVEFKGKKVVANPAVRGARKVYATMFQSCNVFDKVIDSSTPDLKGVSSYPAGENRIRKVTNHQQYTDSHIVLNSFENKSDYPGEQCLDIRKQPPVYGYGSRKAPDKKGEINLFSKGDGVTSSSLNASGIDCSSFISVALATQGLKVKKTSPPFDPFTTSSLQGIAQGQNSCFENVKFSPENSIAPGDMINVAGSHIIMVDEVGEDPLAIKKFAQRNECNKIKVSDFNFTYLHSGNVNNSYGPSRVHISKHRGGAMFENLRFSAIKACSNIVKGNTSEMNSKSLSINRKFDILRHKSTDKDCVADKKVKLKNEECINGCYYDFEETIKE